MSHRRSNDYKKNGELMPVQSNRAGHNDRYHSESERTGMRDNKRKDPSSAWEKQKIRLENDLYERQSI